MAGKWSTYLGPTVTALALPMIALGAGFNMFAAANFSAACIDLAPDFSASVSALMNTLGSLGGGASSIVTAYIAVHCKQSRAGLGGPHHGLFGITVFLR